MSQSNRPMRGYDGDCSRSWRWRLRRENGGWRARAGKTITIAGLQTRGRTKRLLARKMRRWTWDGRFRGGDFWESRWRRKRTRGWGGSGFALPLGSRCRGDSLRGQDSASHARVGKVGCFRRLQLDCSWQGNLETRVKGAETREGGLGRRGRAGFFLFSFQDPISLGLFDNGQVKRCGRVGTHSFVALIAPSKGRETPLLASFEPRWPVVVVSYF